MQKEVFLAVFNQSTSFLSGDWKKQYAKLLDEEHWGALGERLFHFIFENKFHHKSLPTFNEEIIADYPREYQYFEELKSISESNEKAQLIAKAIEKTPIQSLLTILGQRRTPATITDENGIPPAKKELLESCIFRLFIFEKVAHGQAKKKLHS